MDDNDFAVIPYAHESMISNAPLAIEHKLAVKINP